MLCCGRGASKADVELILAARERRVYGKRKVVRLNGASFRTFEV